jgi:hypothetical protein
MGGQVRPARHGMSRPMTVVSCEISHALTYHSLRWITADDHAVQCADVHLASFSDLFGHLHAWSGNGLLHVSAPLCFSTAASCMTHCSSAVWKCTQQVFVNPELIGTLAFSSFSPANSRIELAK